jgi:MFS family permease
VTALEMPHLENIGISRQVAGLVVTFTTSLGLVGSLASGFLGDIIRKSYIVAIGLVLQCSGLFVLANIQQSWHIIPFLILYGLGFGVIIPMRPTLMADYFGRTNIGTILGLLMGLSHLGSVLSPAVAGWYFDFSGNYRGIFNIYAGALSLAIPALLLARQPNSQKN